VIEKGVVASDLREVPPQMDATEGPQIFDGLLAEDKRVPDEQRDEFAVPKHRRSATGAGSGLQQGIVYPDVKVYDMVFLQREQSHDVKR
jgi:hypothetical protein